MANHTVAFQHHQRILDNMAESLSMFYPVPKQNHIDNSIRIYQPGARVSVLEYMITAEELKKVKIRKLEGLVGR
jgi:hypothetical protein